MKALLLATILVAPGCGRVVFTPQAPQPVTLTPQQQQQLALTQQQLQQRSNALDADNRELEKLLAQAEQQKELYREHNLAMQQQLKAFTERLASTERESQELRSRTQALTASMQQPNLAAGEFRPNNTLLKPLAVSSLPEVSVLQDGDTIRVRIAGNALFVPGSPQLKPGAEMLLRRVAGDVMANYPEHVILIEGHTSTMEPVSAQFPTAHDVSLAQAKTVFRALSQTMATASRQLNMAGFGGNYPIVSNANAEGQQRNRRIELVIYPNKVGGR